MRAGLLNQHISFLAPEKTRNAYGENAIEYKKQFSTMAYAKIDNGNKGNVNDEIYTSYFATFQVRQYHRVQIDENMRIEWDGNAYRILAIFMDKALQCVTIKAELINE